MNTKAKKDKIDSELVNTYFRPGGKGKKPRGKKVRKVKDEKAGLKIAPIVMPVIVAVVFFGSLYLLITKAPRTPLKDITQTAPQAAKSYATSKPSSIIKNEKVLYDFETGENGWEIPSWAMDKPDHVATSISTSKAVASNGRKSLKLDSSFPGGMWTASLAEIQHYLDLSDYEVLSVDIYLPPDAPEGLRAKVILSVGEEWRFTEMSRSIRLQPGKWTNITASIREGSTDWKRTKVDNAFKSDVRKIAIRIESNRKPVYTGPVYIDNFRVGSLAD